MHRAVQVCDLLLVSAAVWLTTLHGAFLIKPTGDTGSTAIQALILCVTFVAVAMRMTFYHSRRVESPMQELRAIFETWLVALATGYLFSLTLYGVNAFHFGVTFITGLVALVAFRLLVRLALRGIRSHGFNTRRVLLVGRGALAHKLSKMIESSPAYGLSIFGSMKMNGESASPPAGIECLGDASEFSRVLADQEIDSVLLCPDSGVHLYDSREIMEQCDIAGIKCYYAPDLVAPTHSTLNAESLGGIPAFTVTSTLGSEPALAIKRCMDIIGSVIGLILCAPVLLSVGVAIWLNDRGPLFFHQVRMGKDGKRFYCYKFRSMCIDAEAKKAALASLNEQDGPVFKVTHDPRITPIGRFIRKYSLDELPQLFNVLKGDMSLVGPRPPVPNEVAQYSWWQRRRISVRPGLTCLWQVCGRNKVSFQEWMELDMFYIDNWSLWMDMKIIMRTMPAVVRGTGV